MVGVGCTESGSLCWSREGLLQCDAVPSCIRWLSFATLTGTCSRVCRAWARAAAEEAFSRSSPWYSLSRAAWLEGSGDDRHIAGWKLFNSGDCIEAPPAAAAQGARLRMRGMTEPAELPHTELLPLCARDAAACAVRAVLEVYPVRGDADVVLQEFVRPAGLGPRGFGVRIHAQGQRVSLINVDEDLECRPFWTSEEESAPPAASGQPWVRVEVLQNAEGARVSVQWAQPHAANPPPFWEVGGHWTPERGAPAQRTSLNWTVRAVEGLPRLAPPLALVLSASSETLVRRVDCLAAWDAHPPPREQVPLCSLPSAPPGPAAAGQKGRRGKHADPAGAAGQPKGGKGGRSGAKGAKGRGWHGGGAH
eukprot:TRINITY_DN19394_c0_g1_i1.p1 TRINITY_DN19394_c0_g1~~TRINITY_DN19394_c0_g1_i1.p1  ORF type:complete len:394 (+),score=53.06 TRINITY_DN19394_c0_g1_i1:91-1182(+)